MSPTHDFDNIGDVLDFDIVKGVIVSVDDSEDTCVVSVAGSHMDALLFYHCRPDSTLRDNGAIEGAAAAFSDDDEVIVLRKKDQSVVKVVGRIDGVRHCGSYIVVLISDMNTGIVIPVSCGANNYEFRMPEPLLLSESAALKISRYQFGVNLAGMQGGNNSQQYMPYIFKYIGRSHASVGHPGLLTATLDPYADWHYNFYILDCTGDSDPGKETIWKPPTQWYAEAFGQDLTPPWYSMSPGTAHGFHWCFEAAIDQTKRIYSPMNTDVMLSGPDVVLPGFHVLSQSGNRFNLQYPVSAMGFYGKNAYTLAYDEESGEDIMSAVGGRIYVGGVGETNIPVDVDPVFFFWPWIPYLDEIRGFNILSYLPKSEIGGGFLGWRVYPQLETFRKWKRSYYTASGGIASDDIFEDDVTVSEWTQVSNGTSDTTPTPCDCGNCGTGEWENESLTTVAKYRSSGERYIPYGLIGVDTPIYMKTVFNQDGDGPNHQHTSECTIAGNFPYVTIYEGGSTTTLADMYDSCGIIAFANTNTRISIDNEAASNEMSLTQSLMVGDDVIFTGESSMSYEMSRAAQDSYLGTIVGTVSPPKPECKGVINYTSTGMGVNQTQNLSWTDATDYPPGLDRYAFTWSLSGGGSISSTTAQNITYTAPATNPNCGNNATISLLCESAVVDALEIKITSSATGNAYFILECESEGSCAEPVLENAGFGWSWKTRVIKATVRIGRYSCNDTRNGTNTFCRAGSFTCSSLQSDGPISCEDCMSSQTYTDGCGVEGNESGRDTCAIAAVTCGAWCSSTLGSPIPLADGPGIGDVVDARSQAMIDAGCCPAML